MYLAKLISLALVCMIMAAACSKPLDVVTLDSLIEFSNGRLMPDKLAIKPEAIVADSDRYAKNLSGYLALPDNFNLPLLLGIVYYQWGEFENALTYFTAAKESIDEENSALAMDGYLFNASLEGRTDLIMSLGENVNSMFSRDAWISLAEGNCDAINHAVYDLSVSGQGNPMTRSVSHLEFLSRWISLRRDAEHAVNFKSEVLTPAIYAVAQGADWDVFIAKLKSGDLGRVQMLLVNDLISIVDSAIRYAERVGDEGMRSRWLIIRDELHDAFPGPSNLFLEISNRRHETSL